ncbi:extensin family protein [Rhizobium sp. LjRoot30]|uniref:extensin-like domain-containing protein n=1 Tax=Rhizobium sp. LjRoot30 TaxID=3342320 RepID=UPI003ED115E9
MRKAKLLAACLSLAILGGQSLPLQGPLPHTDPRKEKKGEETVQPKDSVQGQDKQTQKSEDKKGKDDAGSVATPPAEDLKVEPETTEDHAACLAELEKLGVTFKPAERLDEGKGCGIDKPLLVAAIQPGVALKPEGKLRCPTALALARWTKEAVLPAAGVAFAGDAIASLNQASAYICRLRNNAETGKISEHARGNAVDIASFTFKSGKTVEIKPRREDSTFSGAFQRSVTSTACLYFTTVLDPESDAAHENHLHLDVLQRRGGYRYCR